jgi:hypothetical protein
VGQGEFRKKVLGIRFQLLELKTKEFSNSNEGLNLFKNHKFESLDIKEFSPKI